MREMHYRNGVVNSNSVLLSVVSYFSRIRYTNFRFKIVNRRAQKVLSQHVLSIHLIVDIESILKVYFL